MDDERYDSPDAWRAMVEKLVGKPMTKEVWLKQGFRCPQCGNVATVQEFLNAGTTAADGPAQNCIGRLVKGKGCDWAAYGLIDICKVHVQVEPGKWRPYFEFVPWPGTVR